MSEVTDLNQRVNAALDHIDSPFSASECHGHLAGLFCARGNVSRDEWLRGLGVKIGEGEVDEVGKALGELHDETFRQLNDPDLGFQPLLPDEEDESLEVRVEALGEWCQGFLLGLTEGGLKKPEQLQGDVGEVVRDLVDISRAGSYDLANSEEDESAYAELFEYVRTGVLLVNEELNPIKAPPTQPSRLH